MQPASHWDPYTFIGTFFPTHGSLTAQEMTEDETMCEILRNVQAFVDKVVDYLELPDKIDERFRWNHTHNAAAEL